MLQDQRTTVRELRSHNVFELPRSSTTRKNLGVLERTGGLRVPRRGNRRTGAKYVESGGTADTAPSLAAAHTTGLSSITLCIPPLTWSSHLRSVMFGFICVHKRMYSIVECCIGVGQG